MKLGSPFIIKPTKKQRHQTYFWLANHAYTPSSRTGRMEYIFTAGEAGGVYSILLIHFRTGGVKSTCYWWCLFSGSYVNASFWHQLSSVICVIGPALYVRWFYWGSFQSRSNLGAEHFLSLPSYCAWIRPRNQLQKSHLPTNLRRN